MRRLVGIDGANSGMARHQRGAPAGGQHATEGGVCIGPLALRVARAVLLLSGSLLALSCAEEPAAVEPVLPSAGTLDGSELRYQRLKHSELEFVAASGQSLARYETDTGVLAVLLGASVSGAAPGEPQALSSGLVRESEDGSWYCASSGTFVYQESLSGGSAKVSGFTRLPACAGGPFEASFDGTIAGANALARVESSGGVFGGAVVVDLPSEGAWQFSAPAGDLYFAFDSPKQTSSSGYVVVVGFDLTLATYRLGLACVEASEVIDSTTLKLKGISAVQWCPGTESASGELDLPPQ